VHTAPDELSEALTTHSLVTIDDIRAAAKRIHGLVLRTPLLPLGDGAWLKPESLQPTGSFKIRGALNALSQLSAERRAAGVVTHSSGNHAQAIARAARTMGIRALIVMPDNAPPVKVAGVRADGAEIIFVGPANTERVALAHKIADEQGLELVSSADDARIIAGQGTVGLEIVEQLAELGELRPPTVLVPIGLGGLAAGVSTAIKALVPEARVLGVEPALAADTQESLARGRRVAWPSEMVGRTMADGLRGESPAPLPFAHLVQSLDGVLTVEEAQIAAAVRRAAAELKLVLEPSGAVTLAALDALGPRDGPVVIVASGGNIDADRFIGILRG
jgi:threo-3-hydroxy-L-aspartate ammonia-lyase